MLLTATIPTATGTDLVCSECGTGVYRSTAGTVPSTDVACTDCGKHLDTRADVVPFLDADEYLTYTPSGIVRVNAA